MLISHKFLDNKQMILVSLIVFLTSCGKTYRLNDDDLTWNPYKGGEVLVFHSSQGDVDTIFINDVWKGKTSVDALAINPQYREVLNVRAKHSDPISPNSKNSYLQNNLFTLYATTDKRTQINFDLKAKGAWFYTNPYYKDELIKFPLGELLINNFKYRDVIVLESSMIQYDDRDEFISKIYWSKKSGYIRFDLKNGTYWELLTKIPSSR